MKILKICKYPPINDKESMDEHQLVKKLYKVVDLCVLTNAYEVESENRIIFKNYKELNNFTIKDLKLYSTSPFDNPKTIPKSDYQIEKMIDLGMELFKKHNFDVIEASLSLPYALIGHYLSKLYKKPLILTESEDFYKQINCEHLGTILFKIIKDSKLVLTQKNAKIKDLGLNNTFILKDPISDRLKAYSKAKKN